MTTPTLAVCVVAYNQRAYIEQCIRSVLEQEVDAEVKILVGDDASDDGTSEIVAELAAEHPRKITHLVRKPRTGSFANMRDLLARANGEFVAHVDGDDYWLPGKLARQLAFLQAHPGCAAVYTNAITVDANGNQLGLFNDVGDSRFELPGLLRRGNFLNNSSVMFRTAGKAAWAEAVAPQIDFRAHLWHARHGWIGHVGQPLTAYRVNAQGSMVSGMNEHVRELYWEAIMSVPRDLVSDSDYARGLADFLRRVAFRAVRTRNSTLLRNWAKRVFDASPYGRTHTSVLTLGSILRILGKEAAGLSHAAPSRNRRRVLYRA